jgi:hypothetical protein
MSQASKTNNVEGELIRETAAHFFVSQLTIAGFAGSFLFEHSASPQLVFHLYPQRQACH